MSQRATHTGLCQICGGRQMLPSGVLAKHGYAVIWHQFSGVCPGSGHRPYEQSIELIKASIEKAQARCVTLAAEATKHEAGEGPLMFYRRFKGPKGWGYDIWVEVKELTLREVPASGSYPAYRVPDRIVFSDGEHVLATTYSVRDEKGLRDRYVQHLRGMVERERRYIDWQANRIDGWEEQPLEERG